MKIETKNRNTDQTFETTSFKDTGEVFNDISLKKENRLFFDKISLSEITEFLKVKSIRSAIAWCKKNSVKIFENGKLKVSGQYSENQIQHELGEKIGLWYYYNRKGKLVSVVDYDKKNAH